MNTTIRTQEMLDTAELLDKKKLLIAQGLLTFLDLAIIADTLGESKKVNNRGPYCVLEFEDITLMHYYQIAHAVTKGFNQAFVKWAYQNSIYVSVGNYQKIGNHIEVFRTDRVASLFLVNDDCEATLEQIENQIFVPYHMDWLERIMTLLPKAQAILGTAAKVAANQNNNNIYKELFLDVHPEYQSELVGL